MAGNRRDLLQRGRTLGEQQGVQELWSRLKSAAQFRWHGESHQKILHGQKSRLLLGRPLGGAIPATARTGAVVATVIRKVGFRARRATIDAPAQSGQTILRSSCVL